MHKNAIRFLCGLSVLTFFCPFFQMCSDDMTLKKLPDTEARRLEREDAMTLNAYELSFVKELGIEKKIESTWLDIFFSAIILSSLIAFVRSFKENAHVVRFFYYLNMLLALGFVCSVVLVRLLDDLSQLKYGFYLFMINSIIIIILCKRQYNSLN